MTPASLSPLIALADQESYVAGAYMVFVVLLLIYLAIMASKLSRIQRDLRELARMAEAPDDWKPKAEEKVRS